MTTESCCQLEWKNGNCAFPYANSHGIRENVTDRGIAVFTLPCIRLLYEKSVIEYECIWMQLQTILSSLYYITKRSHKLCVESKTNFKALYSQKKKTWNMIWPFRLRHILKQIRFQTTYAYDLDVLVLSGFILLFATDRWVRYGQKFSCLSEQSFRELNISLVLFVCNYSWNV